jgi:hypothetical protein
VVYSPEKWLRHECTDALRSIDRKIFLVQLANIDCEEL